MLWYWNLYSDINNTIFLACCPFFSDNAHIRKRSGDTSCPARPKVNEAWWADREYLIEGMACDRLIREPEGRQIRRSTADSSPAYFR